MWFTSWEHPNLLKKAMNNCLAIMLTKARARGPEIDHTSGSCRAHKGSQRPSDVVAVCHPQRILVCTLHLDGTGTALACKPFFAPPHSHPWEGQCDVWLYSSWQGRKSPRLCNRHSGALRIGFPVSAQQHANEVCYTAPQALQSECGEEEWRRAWKSEKSCGVCSQCCCLLACSTCTHVFSKLSQLAFAETRA